MGIESHVGYAKNAFLGEKKGNLAYRAKVDETAEGINKILNPIDDVARRKVMGDSIKLIRSLGIQVDSVESLNNTTQDPNKSQQQKENAEIVLDVLAKGAYIAMRYGENEEARADLGSGSVKKIEDRLPEPLKGLGERVRANIIDEPEISRILDELDKQRERHEKNGALGRKTLAKKIEEAYEELDALKIESKYEDQRGMVMAFLGVEAEELGGEKSGQQTGYVSQAILEELRASRQLEETKIMQEKAREKELDKKRKIQEEMLIEGGRVDFFEAMLVHEAAQQADPFSQMAPEWMKDYPDKALLQKITALHNSAYMKLKFGNQFLDELVDPKGQGVYSASNEVMRKMYEIPGVKESKETIMQEMFEPYEENGQFVLRLKGWGDLKKEKEKAGAMEMVKDPADKDGKRMIQRYKTSSAYKFYKEKIDVYQNVRGYQERMVSSLVNDGVVGNETDALQAVAIAWCQLFVGNTWESADVDKDIPPCEAVTAQAWNFCHPENKARNKLLNKEKEVAGKGGVGTEEGWGGQKGQWLARRIEKARSGSKSDQKFVDSYISGEIHPFPERLFCSFAESYDVTTKTGGEMSEAEALMRGLEVDYSKMSISSDPWGSYYDMADSANKLYQATTGKTPLPLDTRGWDEALKWVSVVADARNKLRTNKLLQPNVDNAEFVLWAIVASIKGGVFMESPELVMMTPDVTMMSQQRNLEAILKTRDLVDPEGRKEIMKRLNCSGFASEQKRALILNSLARAVRGH